MLTPLALPCVAAGQVTATAALQLLLQPFLALVVCAARMCCMTPRMLLGWPSDHLVLVPRRCWCCSGQKSGAGSLVTFSCSPQGSCCSSRSPRRRQRRLAAACRWTSQVGAWHCCSWLQGMHVWLLPAMQAMQPAAPL